MKSPVPSTARPSRPREKAWECFTTNLALPGFGSIAARRWVGWLQAPACVAAFLATLLGAAHLAVWYFANRSRLNSGQADPIETLKEMWIHSRWALGGIALFGVDWMWALFTSLGVLHRAKAQATEAPAAASPADSPGEGI